MTSPGSVSLQPEEKQRASVAFSQLRAAMGTLGITTEEQAALWRILAGIYHLGAAGACKGKGSCFPHTLEWGGSLSCQGSVFGAVGNGEMMMMMMMLIPRMFSLWWLQAFHGFSSMVEQGMLVSCPVGVSAGLSLPRVGLLGVTSCQLLRKDPWVTPSLAQCPQ